MTGGLFDESDAEYVWRAIGAHNRVGLLHLAPPLDENQHTGWVTPTWPGDAAAICDGSLVVGRGGSRMQVAKWADLNSLFYPPLRCLFSPSALVGAVLTVGGAGYEVASIAARVGPDAFGPRGPVVVRLRAVWGGPAPVPEIEDFTNWDTVIRVELNE